jgi:hypothetical protein
MQDDPLYFLCPFCNTAIEAPAEGAGADIISCCACHRKFVADTPARRLPAAGAPTMTPVQKWTRKEAGFKLFGIGLLVLAAVALMGYFTVWEPLEKMRRHEPDVSYSMKIIVFLPLFAAVGAGLVVMGLVIPWLRETAPARQPSGMKKFLGVLFLAVMMVPGWLLFSWFEDEAAKAGYARGSTAAPPPIPVPKMAIPKVPQPDFQRHQLQVQEPLNAVRKTRDDADKARRP